MSEEHSNHEQEHETHGTRHLLMMLVCCVLPIVVVIGLSFAFPGNPYLNLLALAICPLSMIFMMIPNLFSKKKKEKSSSCH